MKTWAIVLSTLCIAAFAMAADPPVQLHLGSPKRLHDPAHGDAAASEWVEFQVKVTNSSFRPVWLYGYALDYPMYGLFTRRTNSDAWAVYHEGLCDTGTDFHQFAPGAAITFSIAVPAQYIGQQLCVKLPVFDAPHATKPLAVSSNAIDIKLP